MIISEKILSLRKSSGWSQEELAERLHVSRQSVSKWESAAAIPDINKILEMSRQFGVSTDYLLKDDLDAPDYSGRDETDPRKPLGLSEANAFLEMRRQTGKWIAFGVALCIISPASLILLAGTSQEGNLLSEEAAAGIGMVVLLVLVAAAVGIFITCGAKMKPYDSIQKGQFLLEYGVEGIIREKMASFQGEYLRNLISGIILCILSAIPLILGGILAFPDFILIGLTALLLCIVAAGVFLIISAASAKSGFDQLLLEGEYDPEEIRKNRKGAVFAGFYWPFVVAVYLLWSFVSGDWGITWIIWPVAALLFAAVSAGLRAMQEDK